MKLYTDHFQNYKRYNIPKAQLIIADIPFNLGNWAYASNPAWYKDGDNKNGPKSRWTLADLQEMREMLKGNSYSEVAEHYGLKRGDNVYQVLKRAGMLPEGKRRGRSGDRCSV